MPKTGLKPVPSGDIEAEDVLVIERRLASVSNVVANVVNLSNREVILHHRKSFPTVY